MAINELEPVHDLDVDMRIRQAKGLIKSPLYNYLTIAKTLPEVPEGQKKEAMKLLTEFEQKTCEEIQQLVKDSFDLRKAGNTKAPKPADLYRRHANTLRTIMKRKGAYAPVATDIYQELYLEQTLSNGDLETPDHVEPYTKQVEFENEAQFEAAIPEQHTITSVDEGWMKLAEMIASVPSGDAINGTAPVIPPEDGFMREMKRAARRMKQELNWTDEQCQAFLDAQTQGAAGEVVETYIENDDRVFTPPPLRKDFEISMPWLYDAEPVVKAFHQGRTDIFAQMQKERNSGKRFLWADRFHFLLRNSRAFANVINKLDEICASEVSDAGTPTTATTAAAIFLRLEGSYGLNRNDIRGVRSGNGSLAKFVNLYEADIREVMGDGGGHGRLTEEDKVAVIEEFDDETQRKVAQVCSDTGKVTDTAAWNIGFARAAAAGGTWDQATEAAWGEWRLQADPKAAKQYNIVKSQGATHQQAMGVFWRSADQSVPRPKSAIKCIAGDRTGLVLANGRKITWTVAAIKAKNNELDFEGKQDRLKAKLEELKIGQRLAEVM